MHGQSHEVKSGIEKDVDHFIEDLDRVSAKYWATHKIDSKYKPPEARKKEGTENGRETREGLQLQITEGKEYMLYVGPWEENLLKTTMNQRFMRYCNCSRMRKKLCR